MTDIDPFWRWVADRKAHSNSRGDFIRDSRDLLERGIDPETRVGGMCREAGEEHRKLRRSYAAMR